MTDDVREKASKIKLLIFDVDGVLTDGKLLFDEHSNEYKRFHSRDGLGITLLRETGVEVAVISGRASKSVAQRMASLGIERVFQGQRHKLAAYEGLRMDLNLEPGQVAYVGDDLLDLPVMRRVGLSIAVADAHPSILPYAHWVTGKLGGEGAAREVCDLIMDAQGNLKRIIESHF